MDRKWGKTLGIGEFQPSTAAGTGAPLENGGKTSGIGEKK